MTVKFFPLWFKNDLKLSPVGVQAVYLVQALMMAGFNGVAELAARYVGRVPVMILFKVVGISLLCCMALLKDWAAPHSASNSTAAVSQMLVFGGSAAGAATVEDAAGYEAGYEAGSGGGGGEGGVDVGRIAKICLLSVIYLIRTCLMNCTYPVEQSILMDFVPKATRARWTSLDSVSSFGWCGSAALGGIIADKCMPPRS